MNEIKRQWRILADKINALNLRERILLSLAGIACVYGAWDSLFQSAWQGEHQQLSQALEREETLQRQLTQSIQEVSAREKNDPNTQLRQKLESLNSAIKALDARKEELAGSFVRHDKMADLLRGLMKDGSLRLVSLESQSTESLLTYSGKDKDKDNLAPKIFRHYLMVDMEGDYFALLNYLYQVEQQPLYCESIDYRTKSYPNAEIKLRVYTLSFEQE